MSMTIRRLLEHAPFRLRTVTDGGHPTALDRTLSWVHSSDLTDPTPWLEPGQLLLTDGMRFLEATDAAFARAYVERLIRSDVVGLGFATRILHDAVPQQLADECASLGLPLLEVRDRTPFMAIIRFVADDRQREERARLEHALEAHRAVARAALKPNGLDAILAELEQQLGTWVALFDEGGRPSRRAGRAEIPADERPAVEQAVRRLLTGGTRASLRDDRGAGGFVVQTIGRRDALVGALAVGTTTPLDPLGNDLVTSVIAIASTALEQTAVVRETSDTLAAAILELLLSGQIRPAIRVASARGLRLPAGPIRAALVPVEAAPADLTEVLRPLRAFSARHGDEHVVVTAADDRHAAAALAAAGAVVATSSAHAWDELPAAVREARQVLATGVAAGSVRSFDEEVERGLLGLLHRHDGALVSSALLAPARATEEGRRLLAHATVWLRHNGALDPAARELGIHRHTLRKHLETLGALIVLDFDRFGDRAELWTALQLTDRSF